MSETPATGTQTAANPPPPGRECDAGFTDITGTYLCGRWSTHLSFHRTLDGRCEWLDDGHPHRPADRPAPPVEPSTDTADDHEPENGATVLAFEGGIVRGAWHRRDNPWRDTPRRWFSTYINGDVPSTWAEAVEYGASWAHDLHTSPTQDAYEAVCRALEKHRKRANDAEAAAAPRRTSQTCPRSVHRDWWHDGPDLLPCPWCALDAAREQRGQMQDNAEHWADEARDRGDELAKLRATAKRALDSLDDVMDSHDDPGSEAFGAAYELRAVLS